jgi:hypothetical protein
MKKYFIGALAVLAVFTACRRRAAAPRPTIPLVLAVSADTLGVGHIATRAGHIGAAGSVAIIGDPSDAISLAQYLRSSDSRDNIDGRYNRDSLPDFAGECFEVILDAYNEPYSHFVTEGPDAREHLDSLREVAVRNALFAWDSTSVRTPAKILVFTSPLQAEYGLFDVDTLQRLTGGRSLLLTSADAMLEEAYSRGSRHILVWTGAKTRASGAWQAVFARKGWEDATLSVLSPPDALDIRTELRSLLRQYRSEGRKLDVILLDTYQAQPSYLASELDIIRQTGTEEDASFDRMLSRDFYFIEPRSALAKAVYDVLRSGNLFTHRIARPLVRYYLTEESVQGGLVLEEADASYVESAYVQDFR